MTTRITIVMALSTVLCAGAASAANSMATSPLTPEQIKTFCGSPDHETSARYSEAVLAEIKRREAAGARSTKEAVRSMRVEYCNTPGSSQ